MNADKPGPSGGLNETSAYEAGRAAHGKGVAVEAVPSGFKVAKSFLRAWVKGWRDAARAAREVIRIVTPAPEVKTLDLSIAKRAPEGKPDATHYERQQIHCPECRSVWHPDVGQAVRVKATTIEIARLECHVCGFGKGGDYKLPIERR